ncbi:hypothetical protein GM661_09865 [Iocasia frigidifontis]|uniref:Alginate export domain-containing protein n=1 Tax=Iocasia fonsfrigidae TaxID=2682810 RepID=A0A8A7KJF9_9FIRM|nr:DUF1302 family protein [Iocasia fonsfrigidae]QTL98264.1 hypothetical protein GM661_09865 [Iocasia fonsfrigidae]
MKDKIFSILLSWLFFMFFSWTNVYGSDLELSGEWVSRLEAEFQGENDIILFNSLGLDLNYNSSMSAFKASLDITDDDDDPNVSLEEAYGEFYFQSTDLRIGKQYIAWGKTDGINPTDNFNPEDLTDPFSEDNKLAVNAVRAKHYQDDWIFDLIWAPLFTAAELPKAGSRWSSLPAGLEIEPQEPENSLENSEIGVRASKWAGSIDFSFSYFRGWSKTPAWPDQSIIEDGQLVFKPEYYQVDVFGTDWARDFGSFVFRGELAYFKTKKDFQLKNPYSQYVLGVDFNATDELYIITQLVGEKEEGEDRTDNLTVSLEYELTEFKTIELNGIYNLADRDSLINPLFNYEIRDGLAMTLGAYIFSGEDGSSYGWFDEKDYVYIELVRSF